MVSNLPIYDKRMYEFNFDGRNYGPSENYKGQEIILMRNLTNDYDMFFISVYFWLLKAKDLSFKKIIILTNNDIKTYKITTQLSGQIIKLISK